MHLLGEELKLPSVSTWWCGQTPERRYVEELLARHGGKVAAAAQGFSGAEIESVVQTALYAAYSQKQQLTTQHLLDALKHTVPLSTTRAEEIAALRAWARERAVPASGGTAVRAEPA